MSQTTQIAHKGHQRKKFDLRDFNTQRTLTIITFLLIPVVLLLTFTYRPLLDMMGYSMMKWNGFGRKEFIGLENYKEILMNPKYLSAFKTSIYYFIGSVVQIIVALYFATLFFFGMKGKNVFKSILFFPSLLNGVAISFTFLYFFKQGGVLDTVLITLGVAPEALPLWLGDISIVNVSLVFVSVWRYMGHNMVLFSGAMASVNTDLLEAAQIDGASRTDMVWRIIVPNIRAILSLSLLLSIKGAISVYEIPFIMTKGMNGSSTFVMEMLDIAFSNQKIGLSCALGMVMLAIVFVITMIQMRITEGEER